MPPKVSVIVPCYNEQSTIRLLLDALCEQTYPRTEMEVIVADGLSTDGTRDVITAFQKDVPDLRVRVVDNPNRYIPSAVNRAIEVSRGEIIVRVDAHSKPYPDYVANCIAAHEAGRGDNVGGCGRSTRAQTRGWQTRSRLLPRIPWALGTRSTDMPITPQRWIPFRLARSAAR